MFLTTHLWMNEKSMELEEYMHLVVDTIRYPNYFFTSIKYENVHYYPKKKNRRKPTISITPTKIRKKYIQSIYLFILKKHKQ